MFTKIISTLKGLSVNKGKSSYPIASYNYEECQLGEKSYWISKVHIDVLEKFNGYFSHKTMLRIRKQKEHQSTFNGLQEIVSEEFIYENVLLDEINASKERKALALKYNYKLMNF